MVTIPIDRVSGISPAEFARRYVDGGGRPAVVTDAIDQWPARTQWTFDYFKRRYGDDTVAPRQAGSSTAVRVTKLADFLDYVSDPSTPPRGFWLDPVTSLPTAAPADPSAPLYLQGWFALQLHPELYAGIEPAPYFIEDWVRALSSDLRDAFEWTSSKEYWSVYVGPAGTISHVHQDYWHTHSYLAQLQGRKRCFLFAPGDREFLYDGQVDPEAPDFDRFPLFRQATAFEATIGPGDVVYTPPDWWHHVRSIEPSVTVSHNFFNGANFAAHMSSFTRALPNFVSGLEQKPEIASALGVNWRSLGFEKVGKSQAVEAVAESVTP